MAPRFNHEEARRRSAEIVAARQQQRREQRAQAQQNGDQNGDQTSDKPRKTYAEIRAARLERVANRPPMKTPEERFQERVAQYEASRAAVKARSAAGRKASIERIMNLKFEDIPESRRGLLRTRQQPSDDESSDSASSDDGNSATDQNQPFYPTTSEDNATEDNAPASDLLSRYDLPADFDKKAHEDSTIIHDTDYVPNIRYDTHFPPRSASQLAFERRKMDNIMRNKDAHLEYDERMRIIDEFLAEQSSGESGESDEDDQRPTQRFRGMQICKSAGPTPHHLKWWVAYRNPEFHPETAHVIPPDQVRRLSPQPIETPERSSFNWNLASNSNSLILASTPAEVSERESEERGLEDESLEDERLEDERVEEQRAEEKRLEEQRLEEHRLEEQRLEEQRLEEQRLEEKRLEEQRREEKRLERMRLDEQRGVEKRLEKERLEVKDLTPEQQEIVQERRAALKDAEEDLREFDTWQAKCAEQYRAEQEERRKRDERGGSLIDRIWANAYVEKGMSPDPEVREQVRLEKALRYRKNRLWSVANAKKNLKDALNPRKAEAIPNALGITTPPLDNMASPDASSPESPVSPTPVKQPKMQAQPQLPANGDAAQRASNNVSSEQPQPSSQQEAAKTSSCLTRPDHEDKQKPASVKTNDAQPSSSQETAQTPPTPEEAHEASPWSLTPEELARFGPHAKVEQVEPVRALFIPAKHSPFRPQPVEEDPRPILRALSRALMREADEKKKAEARENPSDDVPTQLNETKQEQGLWLQRSMTARLDAASTSIRDAYRITKQLLASIDTTKLTGKKCTTCEACGHVEQQPLMMICTGVTGLMVSRNEHGRMQSTWFGFLLMLLLLWYMMELLITETFGTSAYASTMDGYGVFPDSPRYPFALVTLISWIPPFSWLLPLFQANTFSEATRTVDFF